MDRYIISNYFSSRDELTHAVRSSPEVQYTAITTMLRKMSDDIAFSSRARDA